MTIICLVNGEQRVCDERSKTWEAELPSRSFARFPISLELREGDRVEVLRVVDGETERFHPASGGLVFFAGRQESPTASDSAGQREKVLGGCDVAAFTATESNADNVLRSASASSRKFLVVEFCTEGTWIVRPVLVADGQRVLELRATEGFGFTEVRGRTFVAEIPRGIDNVSSIQGFVLVDPIVPQHVLVTPALKTV